MSINNYSLKGISNSVQYGKNGGVFNWDSSNNYFILRTNSSNYSKILLNNVLIEEIDTAPNSVTNFSNIYSLDTSKLYVKFSNNTIKCISEPDFDDISNNPLTVSVDDSDLYTNLNFSVGNTDPQSKFHVTNSDTNANSSVSRIETASNSDTNTKFIEFYDANGLQGKITGGSSGGTVYSTTSDERLKTDIIDTTLNCSELINNIKIRDFKWKNSNISDTGMIAQELEKVYSKAVLGKDDEIKTIDQQSLIPILIKSMQEIIHENKILNNKIKQLENKYK